MILYRTERGPVVKSDEQTYHLVADADWDGLINRPDLRDCLFEATRGPTVEAPKQWLAPVVGQEVWAAGVTYTASPLEVKAKKKRRPEGRLFKVTADLALISGL